MAWMLWRRWAPAVGVAACVLGPGVTGASAQVTATTSFASPGSYSFVVPAGVSSITVTAVGAVGGSNWPAGPHGPPGKQGPSGKIELVTCNAVTKTVATNIKGKRRKIAVQKCSGRLVSGSVTFTTTGSATSATIARGRVAYATGKSVPTGDGGWQLVLAQEHPLTPGHYMLTLRSRHHGRWTSHKEKITIS
jgi:hypothetical protein